MEEHWKDYFAKGLAVFLTVAMCILFFFAVFRFERIRDYTEVIAEILRPFLIGSVIAYLLAPLCNFLERRLAELFVLEKMSGRKAVKYRKFFGFASIVASLAAFCLVIYALIAMVVPQLIDSILLLVDAMPGYIQIISAWLEKLVADNPLLLNYVEQYSEDIMSSAQDFARTYLVPNINNIISGVSTSLWTLISFAKDFLIGLIVAVYLLGSRRIFKSQAIRIIRAAFSHKIKVREEESAGLVAKPLADVILLEINQINILFGGFIKGKLLDSLIIGCICMAFTALFQMPYAVLVSVVIGVTNIIPFFGPFIGAIPSALLILIISPLKCIYFIIFILILQQFDGNILGPKILGNTTDLSSFWVLFAILLFGGLYGIVGMIVGVPAFAFLYRLVRKWVLRREWDQRQEEKENL